MLLNPITHSANVKLNLAAISFIWSSTMSPVYFQSEKSLQKPKRSQGASQRGVFSVFVFVPFIFDDFFTCLVSPLRCFLYTMILIRQHICMALPISTIELGQKQANTYNSEFLNHVGFWQGVLYMWFLSKVLIGVWNRFDLLFYGFFSETKSRVIMITFIFYFMSEM
jgi:hypothetical protein